MIINVYPYWNGGNDVQSLGFEIRSLPKSKCKIFERIPGVRWTSKTAQKALDILEFTYGINRKNVRFKHL